MLFSPIFDIRKVSPVHLIPKPLQVDDKKNQDEGAQYTHISGTQTAVSCRIPHRIGNRPCFPVSGGNDNGINYMGQYGDIGEVRQYFNEGIGGHKGGILVKGLPSVVLEQ